MQSKSNSGGFNFDVKSDNPRSVLVVNNNMNTTLTNMIYVIYEYNTISGLQGTFNVGNCPQCVDGGCQI